ncbi:hypothetical protein [Jeotgalibacillus proteolyticus]|uniref:hypothetical protein n=1 Tax=Jeotgalibacillus proteolyticus TaxID=2082395 RepID=UPI003CF90E6A
MNWRGGTLIKPFLFAVIAAFSMMHSCENGVETKAKSKKVDDFSLAVKVVESSEGRTLSADIMYTGEEAGSMIIHNNGLFDFTVKTENGDVIDTKKAGEDEVVTRLRKDEVLTFQSGFTFLDDLEPGLYEFTAEADFHKGAKAPEQTVELTRMVLISE